MKSLIALTLALVGLELVAASCDMAELQKTCAAPTGDDAITGQEEKAEICRKIDVYLDLVQDCKKAVNDCDLSAFGKEAEDAMNQAVQAFEAGESTFKEQKEQLECSACLAHSSLLVVLVLAITALLSKF